MAVVTHCHNVNGHDEKKTECEYPIKGSYHPARRNDQVVGNAEENRNQNHFQYCQSSAHRGPVEMNGPEGTTDTEKREQSVEWGEYT